MRWSDADERELVRLQSRKDAVMKAHRAAVEGLAHKLLESGKSLADSLIERADEARDALAPFDSGVRPHKFDVESSRDVGTVGTVGSVIALREL